MLYAGTNIQSSSDKLLKVSIEHLYHSLRHPKPEIEARIRQLRVVRSLDSKGYSMVKRTLPYIVCGNFNPSFRKTENFTFIEYFIIDIDHITDKGYDLQALRALLQTDKRVLLSFVSPGEDGLKVLFHLSERCYDAGLYSLFYKEFTRRYALQFNIEQVVDAKTSDVTRACFISMDPNVYYNPDAEDVVFSDYIDMHSTQALFDMKKEQDKENKDISTQQKATQPKGPVDPDKETMAEIRAILKGKQLAPVKRDIIVPAELDQIINDLKNFIEEQGLEVLEILNIQYAKKIRCRLGQKQAEVNLFFGRRGFNPVKSPRCGTSDELNQLLADIITYFINTH